MKLNLSFKEELKLNSDKSEGLVVGEILRGEHVFPEMIGLNLGVVLILSGSVLALLGQHSSRGGVTFNGI